MIKPPRRFHLAGASFLIAVLAGVVGFWLIAGTAAIIARILFLVFIVCSLFCVMTSRRPPAS